MKKYKKILIFLLPFLLTGCTVTYRIDIKNHNIKIDGELIETDSTKWEQVVVEDSNEEINHNQDPDACQNGKCDITDGIFQQEKLTFSQLVDLKTINLETKIDGLNRIKNSDKLGISYQNKFSYSKYNQLKKLPGANTCYQYFSVIRDQEDSGFIISTSFKNLCFTTYSNLEEIKIILNTNHVVKSNNADQVDKNEYTWIIDKENSQNKTIQVNISDEVVKNNNYLLIIIVFGAILIIIFSIYLILNLKNKKANQI